MGNGYHHGNLRRALLDEAALMIASSGAASLSLRELARRVEVSHAAPAHHFGDRRALLSALAAQGFRLLAESLRGASRRGFDEAAVAYVRFALSHPGHYAVMFRKDLLNPDDAELTEARTVSWRVLAAGVESVPLRHRKHLSSQEAAHTAWALVHGLVTLAAEFGDPGRDMDDFVRRSAMQLFGARPR